MIARKQLDIGWSDLAYGLAACARLVPPASEMRPLLTRRADAVVCLSVRSALDLLLAQLAWPAGTEILVTAITIPDIPRILRAHGLVPVAVDVDPATFAPDERELARLRTPRTRAFLFAHLFGARLPTTTLIRTARALGLEVWEDCAQAYTGDDFAGDEASDVRFFSFGPIKTATAFGGGVMLVRDAARRGELARRHATWPVQRTGAYLRRLLKFGAVKPLLGRQLFGGVVAFCRFAGRDVDALIMRTGRGFVGEDFFPQLRRRPCAALVRVLERRLATYDAARVARRAAAGERLRAGLREPRLLGTDAAARTHWLCALPVPNREARMRELWAAGFDATCASSSLCALPAAPRAEAAMAHLLYVPAYAGMHASDIDGLADLLNSQADPARPRVAGFAPQ